MFGWCGKILRVDLSTGKIEVQPVAEDKQQALIGGRGMNIGLLFEGVHSPIDAFDPENQIAFGTGPFTGTLVPGGARFNVTTRSPVTFLGDSSCGGHWGPELKFAGFDHVVVTGQSEKPVYLWIQDGQAELRDAEEFWGQDTWETQKRIQRELKDPNVKVLCIGPAGENKVRMAIINTGLKHATARTGTGAVMGAKGLKAIAVRGRQGVKIADRSRFIQACQEATERLEAFRQSRGFPAGEHAGTYSRLWEHHNEELALGTRHHRFCSWEDWETLSPKHFHEHYRTKMVGCFACPVHCTPRFSITEGPFQGLFGEGPGYHSVSGYGAQCINTDLAAVLNICVWSDKLGIDSCSTGRVIAFAMELFERGILAEGDIGFPLRWGDADAMLRLLKMIAFREGIGNIFAEGEARAAAAIGGGAEQVALTVKGLELLEPVRVMGIAHALGQSASTRGSDHLRTTPIIEIGISTEEAQKFFGVEGFKLDLDPTSYSNVEYSVVFNEYNAALADMLGFCKSFSHWLRAGRIDPDLEAELFSACTGVEVSEFDLIRAAERVYNLERAFITIQGVTRHDDYPPAREFEVPLESGPRKGAKLDRGQYDALLDRYYSLHGWDKDGVPAVDKLEELGLKEVNDHLVTARTLRQV